MRIAEWVYILHPERRCFRIVMRVGKCDNEEEKLVLLIHRGFIAEDLEYISSSKYERCTVPVGKDILSNKSASTGVLWRSPCSSSYRSAIPYGLLKRNLTWFCAVGPIQKWVPQSHSYPHGISGSRFFRPAILKIKKAFRLPLRIFRVLHHIVRL